jgi:hypothetical protein
MAMRRLIVMALAVGASTVALASAHGLTPEYGGTIEGKSDRYLGFDRTRIDGKDFLTRIFEVNMKFHHCDDPMDDGEESGGLDGKVKVKPDGSFDETKSYNFEPAHKNEATGLTYRLAGQLDGRTAEGIIQIDLKGNGCKSGKQSFEVKKPAPPVPPRVESLERSPAGEGATERHLVGVFEVRAHR